MGEFGSVFLIDLMRLDETADARPIAAWEVARAFLQSKRGFHGAELYRSLRPHAQFRLVNVVEVESVDAWRQLIGDPDFPLPDMALNNHPGLYEVVEHDPLGGGVTVVNAFDCPADADDSSFTEPWDRIHDFMQGRRGHRGTRLLRCVGAADFRYVTIAGWEDEQAFADTIQSPAFGEIASEMPFDTHTGVYELIRR